MNGTPRTSPPHPTGEPQPLTHNAQRANMENHTIDRQCLVERLKKVSHFQNVPEHIIKDIVFAGQILNFPAEAVLYREEEAAAGLYVIFKGQVNLCKIGLRGQISIISVIKPVIMFNEVTAIDGGPNPVTAIATKDSVTWQISYERFQTLMKRYPIVGTGLLRILAERNRVMLRLYEDLISRPVAARVAKSLLDLSHNGHNPINRYQCSNYFLAALAATVPEAVSRSIKSLKTQGILDCSRAQIKILLPEELGKCALLEPTGFDCMD